MWRNYCFSCLKRSSFKTDFKVLNKISSYLIDEWVGLFMIGGNIVSGFLSEIFNLLDYQADTSVNQEMINQMLTSNLAP